MGDFCRFWNASCLTALLKVFIDQDYMIYGQEGGPRLPSSCPLHSSNTPGEANLEDLSLIYQSRSLLCLILSDRDASFQEDQWGRQNYYVSDAIGRACLGAFHIQ